MKIYNICKNNYCSCGARGPRGRFRGPLGSWASSGAAADDDDAAIGPADDDEDDCFPTVTSRNFFIVTFGCVCFTLLYSNNNK